MTGIYLENEGLTGSIGAHWEKWYFGNELLTAESNGNEVLSNFTLIFL